MGLPQARRGAIGAVSHRRRRIGYRSVVHIAQGYSSVRVNFDTIDKQ
jgi:hypothetical protein